MLVTSLRFPTGDQEPEDTMVESGRGSKIDSKAKGSDTSPRIAAVDPIKFET
jgi:hypothetical protein